jgi:peptidoglycan hydrolase-like protein with peptidoglycan-binding domain
MSDTLTAADRIADREPRQRRRRRGPLIAAVLVVLVAAGGAATVLGLGAHDPGQGKAAASDLPPATATVTKQTLHDTETVDGELGYGAATDVIGRLPGTITWLPDTGDRIGRGKRLYEVDDRPVTLMYGTLPAYRELRQGVEGRDVKQLERNLKALGYDGFTVDDEYTYATAVAVEEWQDDRGLEETGTVPLGQVVFAPGAVRVDSVVAERGGPATPGGKVLSYTGTGKAVTAELDTSDQRLAKKGAKVKVTLPDDTTITGRVDEVATVIVPGGNGEEATTQVEVTVALKGKKAQRAADEYAMAAVDVAFTAGTRKNVLTVPVAALVALREGGYGLEVVSGGTSSYVPVETGLFADGRVEVSGDGIGAGTIVGMPK